MGSDGIADARRGLERKPVLVVGAVKILVDGFADYERLPRSGIVWDLARIEKLLERLGNPQDAARSVHIAGTKGKGSTATMIASILTRAGYRVGYDEEGLTLGLGVLFPSSQESDARVDYAYVDMGNLDSIQRLSVMFVF